ncbi:MAG: hypothetical protein CO093_05750 [Alphaproteobacteria bacterium CG_4_9_14_3_um_filter_47_13]|nr:MAG: hypothetical protein CO093_05750 [Alphaproteobacteria bacterium CG_4_9_14_3_um_filter_47_13]
MTKPDEIIFLNRAYNDLDMQLPLIEEFSREDRFKVRVIGYPCDGGTGAPQRHEAVPYMKARYKNLSFETVLDKAPAPFHLRLLHKVASAAATERQKCTCHVLEFPFKVLHVGTLKILKSLFSGKQKWLDNVAATWKPAVIILDEVYAQPGRSYMTDTILPALQEKNVPVYMIQTGHHIYKTDTPSGDKKPAYKKTEARRFFIPGQLDKNITTSHFPDEHHEIAGNLRMDQRWLQKLHHDILQPPHFPREKTMSILPEGKPKIAFMLSKLTYGIRVEELKQTIRTLGHMEGVALALKPHTRGMKFDFMPKEDIGHAVIAGDIPSPLLIEWADILVFTGSSIAYHMMLLDKPAGFLKYCQKIETVFDEGKSALVFEMEEQLIQAIKAFRDSQTPFIPEPAQKNIRAHLCQEVYAGDETGRTAAHYKNIIMKDLGL